MTEGDSFVYIVANRKIKAGERSLIRSRRKVSYSPQKLP